ncbi:hypothetical protein BH10PAT3_BH10PAT3_6210 [soil metagenome]
MPTLYFDQLVRENPNDLSHKLRKRFKECGEKSEQIGISDSAQFDTPVKIHLVKKVGGGTVIHAGTTLEAGVKLGDEVTIGRSSYLSRCVRIGSVAFIGERNFFAPRSGLRHDYSYRSHVYMRQTRDDVTVGPGVILPSEAQIGSSAIIPTRGCIQQIGRFGTSQRMVTIYGGMEGPLYSVGCQFGIDGATFIDRVTNVTDTKPESAQDYAKHMSAIQALGVQVQRVYEREDNLVEELAQQQMELCNTPLQY